MPESSIPTITASSIGSTPSAVPPIVHEVLHSPGQPLDAATRAFMEPRFGHDFSRVQVHSDTKAAESAWAVNALAYTVGRNVVFGEGQYAPATTMGRKLLAHELTHVVQQDSTRSSLRYRDTDSDPSTSSSLVQRKTAPRPTSQRVWGFWVTRRMCDCRPLVRGEIRWANTAGATYAACDTPANPTGSNIEVCFRTAHPGTAPVGWTSPSGTITLPPPSANPCQRIIHRAIFVHETMHSRHAEAIALNLRWPAFYSEWKRLASNPNRLSILQQRFPTAVTSFLRSWNNGHEWAQDEINAYRWQRRFLEDVLAALTRIC